MNDLYFSTLGSQDSSKPETSSYSFPMNILGSAWRGKWCLYLLAFGCALTSLRAAGASGQTTADLLVVGDIYTVDGARTWARAMAVQDGKIVYVGTDKGAEPYRGKETKVLTLAPGQMVL